MPWRCFSAGAFVFDNSIGPRLAISSGPLLLEAGGGWDAIVKGGMGHSYAAWCFAILSKGSGYCQSIGSAPRSRERGAAIFPSLRKLSSSGCT